MMLYLRLTAHMGRRATSKSKGPSLQAITDYKHRKLQKNLKRYSSYALFEHEDKLYQQFVYGHSCHIAGVTLNNFQSQKLSKSAVKSLQPRVLVLGGISDNYLRVGEAMMRMRQRYETPICTPQKLACRERVAKLIQTRLQRDRDLYWDAFKQQMVITNHKDKRVMPADYLTAAHMACLQGDTRIVLGKPSDTLVCEDLIMRYSKADLQGIVQRAVNKARQRMGEATEWRQSYSLETVWNYVMSQEPGVYSRELTFQAALLKRLAKVEDNILLLTPAYFVPRVAEQVHHINVPPEKVFRDGLEDPNSQSYYLLQKSLQSNPEQVLQKFALVCILRQTLLQREFAMGSNVFEKMCFGSLFAGADMNQLRWRYLAAKERASTLWYDLMKHRINNIHILPQLTNKLNLQQQLQVLEERVQKSFPYAYEERNYLSEHQNAVKLAELENRMKEMLNEEGDKHNIQIFDNFLKGRRSRQGIILYSKLLGKANIESVDRLKLPVFHYAAFRGIYKEYLREFILNAQANTQKLDRVKKRLDNTEKLTQEFMKKLDNPYELTKYLSGQKGKVLHFGMDPEDGPSFSPEDLEHLKSLYGQMTAEDEEEMDEQYQDESVHQKQ